MQGFVVFSTFSVLLAFGDSDAQMANQAKMLRSESQSGQMTAEMHSRGKAVVHRHSHLGSGWPTGQGASLLDSSADVDADHLNELPNVLLRSQKENERSPDLPVLMQTDSDLQQDARGARQPAEPNWAGPWPFSQEVCVPGEVCLLNGGFEIGAKGDQTMSGLPLGWQGYPEAKITRVRSGNTAYGELRTLDQGYFMALGGAETTLLQTMTGLTKGHIYKLSFQAGCKNGLASGEVLSVNVCEDVFLKNLRLPVNKFKNMTISFVAPSVKCRVFFTNEANKLKEGTEATSLAVYLDNIRVEKIVEPPPLKQPYLPGLPNTAGGGQSFFVNRNRCNTIKCCKRKCEEAGYCCNEDVTKAMDGKLSCLQACTLQIMGSAAGGYCPIRTCTSAVDPNCRYDAGNWRVPVMNLFGGCKMPSTGRCRHDGGCEVGYTFSMANEEYTMESRQSALPLMDVKRMGEQCLVQCNGVAGPCEYCGKAGACCTTLGDPSCNDYLTSLQDLVPRGLPGLDPMQVKDRCVPAGAIQETKMRPSRLSCQALNWTKYLGRVPVQYTATGRGVAAHTSGQDSLAGSEALPVTPKFIRDQLRGRAITECAGGKMSFAKAVQYCSDAGARLCTAKELQYDVAKWTGCHADTYRVWSASMCDSGRGYKTLSGASQYSKEVPDKCTRMDALEVVRCCCDEEEVTCGLAKKVMSGVMQNCGTLPHDCMLRVALEQPSQHCAWYCERHNLQCLGGWTPKMNASGATCEAAEAVGCKAVTGRSGGQLICECDVKKQVQGVPVNLNGNTDRSNQQSNGDGAGGKDNMTDINGVKSGIPDPNQEGEKLTAANKNATGWFNSKNASTGNTTATGNATTSAGSSANASAGNNAAAGNASSGNATSAGSSATPAGNDTSAGNASGLNSSSGNASAGNASNASSGNASNGSTAELGLQAASGGPFISNGNDDALLLADSNVEDSGTSTTTKPWSNEPPVIHTAHAGTYYYDVNMKP